MIWTGNPTTLISDATKEYYNLAFALDHLQEAMDLLQEELYALNSNLDIEAEKVYRDASLVTPLVDELCNLAKSRVVFPVED
jgi:hypothetical protein